jgi:hypothetical protein
MVLHSGCRRILIDPLFWTLMSGESQHRNEQCRVVKRRAGHFGHSYCKCRLSFTSLIHCLARAGYLLYSCSPRSLVTLVFSFPPPVTVLRCLCTHFEHSLVSFFRYPLKTPSCVSLQQPWSAFSIQLHAQVAVFPSITQQ